MYAVFANIVKDKQLRTGARVLILYHNGDCQRPRVIGKSVGGRLIEKYVHYKNLRNFRAQWIKPYLNKRVVRSWESKDEAQAFADRLSSTWERGKSGQQPQLQGAA